jgi:hypothetical protein
MIDLSEALKEHISQNEPCKKFSADPLKIVEDSIIKLSPTMYKLEFLVTMSELYQNKIISKPIPTYESDSLLNMEEIIKFESYSLMSKFTIANKNRKIINSSHVLRLPKEILVQYLGKDEFMKLKTQKGLISDDFMALYNKDTQNQEMVLIPKDNYNILLSMNNSAKKFLEYFREKCDLNIVNPAPNTFVIKGISKDFRKSESEIVFLAKNQVYIHLKKV